MQAEAELQPILLALLAEERPASQRAQLRAAALSLANGGGAKALHILSKGAADGEERRALRTEAWKAARTRPHGAGAAVLYDLATSATDVPQKAQLRREARTAALARPNGAGARILEALAKEFVPRPEVLFPLTLRRRRRSAGSFAGRRWPCRTVRSTHVSSWHTGRTTSRKAWN